MPEFREGREISIHAPREGSDEARGLFRRMFEISIHAPREGSDRGTVWRYLTKLKDFNPRSPRGERPYVTSFLPGQKAFQSTLPARGATGGTGRRYGDG